MLGVGRWALNVLPANGFHPSLLFGQAFNHANGKSRCAASKPCYSPHELILIMSQLLDAKEIKAALKDLPEWDLEKKTIERTFEFDDFGQAMDFVNGIAELAEEMDHHPDMDIRYNKVLVVLSTHSKGGLTELDFELAERIGTLVDA